MEKGIIQDRKVMLIDKVILFEKLNINNNKFKNLENNINLRIIPKKNWNNKLKLNCLIFYFNYLKLFLFYLIILLIYYNYITIFNFIFFKLFESINNTSFT